MSNDELAALADTALEGLDLSDTITDRRVARSLLREALGLLADGPHALDLKIATNALAEMRDAYEMFAPFRDRRKVTIFGSARTGPDDPVYRQTVRVAAELAARGLGVAISIRKVVHDQRDERRRRACRCVRKGFASA
ncbi:MAG: hypothetical protein ACPGSH_00540, partial [Ilumatobacteraceae bacterium]